METTSCLLLCTEIEAFASASPTLILSDQVTAEFLVKRRKTATLWSQNDYRQTENDHKSDTQNSYDELYVQ